MRRLLVNADDFGLTPGVTDGIIQGHVEGIVTSTSIMAPARAFEHAVLQAKMHERLGVGVHLTLVEELPVCPPDEIATLVGHDGRLPGRYTDLLVGVLSGRIHLDHVEKELRAQVSKCVDAGLRLTHIDSHQHVHAMPSIFRIALRLARHFAIRCIRLPRDSPFSHGRGATGLFLAGSSLGKTALCALSRFDARASTGARMLSCDRMAGLFESGRLSEADLFRILSGLGEGATELCCHPGIADEACSSSYAHWKYNWADELAALVNPRIRDLVREQKIELISYRDLGRS